MNLFSNAILTTTLVLAMLACSPKNGEQANLSTEVKPNTVKPVKRFGSVIKIKPEKLELYKELHADPWPGIQKQITKSNIRNYSIYLKDDFLFAYFEYVGDDFEKDMANMAKDSVTREWWKLTDPCQVPLETRADGEWWANMEEVFHQD